MKNIIKITIVVVLFTTVANAQITLEGKLHHKAINKKILLTNFDGIKIPIIVNSNQTFSYSSDSIVQGFYNIDEIGAIYLTNGYNLKIAPSNKQGQYLFEGVGSLENNAITTAKAKLSDYLQLDENSSYGNMAKTIFTLDPSVFLKKVNNFKNYGIDLISKSNDSFFIKYAILDLEFYCKPYLFYYNAFFGQDLKIWDEITELQNTMDIKSANYSNKIKDLLNKVRFKYMDLKDKEILNNLISNWDKNDVTLFKNSYNYREAISNLITNASFSSKYSIIASVNPEDIFIKKLQIAADTISNLYILNYFNYIFTKDIINTTKDSDTVNKHYRQFVKNNKRADYLKDINEIYQNKMMYCNGMPAPEFKFSNVDGKPIELQNLLGRYVYIDVWATWCVPCKKEIPHLEKLVTAYKDKKIQFVSISVDEQKNKSKWLDYISKNKLNGLQLISDSAFESGFIKNMGIISVPRFMLIDPQGKLIAADALRPSDQELRKMLDKIL